MFQIGDLVKHTSRGYIAIVLEIAVSHVSTKIKPLNYNSYDDWLWVLTSDLQKVS